MATARLWLGLCFVASCLGVIASKGCPTNWKEYGNSCYLFVLPTVQLRQMSWEDSRANCLGYGADLVSILNSSEVDFINKQTKVLGNYNFWIGLFRNKTTSNAKEGWVWSDGSSFTNPQQWNKGEPNNYQNNENCAEFFATKKTWNDNDCAKRFASICKRKKGLPDPTMPTSGTLSPTIDPPPKCDYGWIAYNRSCYRIFSRLRSWSAAKRACRDTGGHLVRIDNDNEQYFLSTLVRPKYQNYWIGLNDLDVPGRWVWEFRSKDLLNYTNWQSGEPNGLGREQCGEMYGHAQAGYWNDASCYGWKSYICEKEEGQNICPESWIAYNDSCYQFNMETSQKMTWSEAEAACNAIGNFASLVKINSQSEQDFVNQRIQSVSSTNAWIGLNDINKENVFKWTADESSTSLDNTQYQVWANGRPSENNDARDCVMILSVRKDGAWSVQNCSQKQNYVCMRHRDLPFCNGPLGMENGKILDSQITATTFLSTNEPFKARFRHSGSWCPTTANQKEYLQVVLPYLADIRTIVTEGNVTSYTLKISKDGKTFRDYNPSASSKQLIPINEGNYQRLDTSSLVAKVVRIYPYNWNIYPCMRVEFVGCPAQVPTSTECKGNNWQKGPGKLCFQINSVQKTWADARSTCLERGGDLLTITTEEEKKAIVAKIKYTSNSYYWISLNDRDYRNFHYWSNNDADGVINWGSGAPDKSGNTNKKGCVRMKRSGSWTDSECSNRFAFICMKGEHYTQTNFVNAGPTGVWMSSAKYYWPLSSIDNNMVLGTTFGKVYGTVTQTSGVREQPNTALQFVSWGSYIDVGKFDKECFGNPDYCSGLSLSFMAWFDKTAISSSKQVYILDSVGDETKYKGISVYIQNNNLWFVVSKTAKYVKTSVPVVENKWRHYVMRYNDSSSISVAVNGRDISVTRTPGVSGNAKSIKNFKIGLQQGSSANSGLTKLAMVAFWDTMLSNYDISSIYKTEFGSCEFSWTEYGMSCYQINKDTKSHASATKKCQLSGGDLINIDTNVEQAFISTQDKARGWIGAHDKNGEGIFTRTNGKLIPYSNWNNAEPNNYGLGEDCSELLGNGFWNDMPCGRYLPYICEKEKDLKVKPTNITTTAVTPVSNITKSALLCHYTRTTIGCPSGLVINVKSAFWGRRKKTTCTYVSVQPCGVKDIAKITNNLKRKCDNFDSCNLHASELESYLTNPCPTVHKYLEVNYTCGKGSQPKVCNPGWTTSNANKRRCYRLFDTPKTWKEARAICSSEQAGAELISIGGHLEQWFLTSLMERTWYLNVWIGLNDLKTKGVYEWSDSSFVSWTNWYVGQPDERRTDKSCVYMSLLRGKRGLMYWSDQNCTRRYAFMCAYNIDSTTQKPTTVSQGNYEKCPAGFISKNDAPYCYYYGGTTNSQNWLDAQNICRTKSAKLVSIQSNEENEFVKNMSKNAIWLGLEAKGVFRGHVWSDGQAVRYTNWDVGQPDSYNGLDACVEINPDTGLWSDRPCNEKKDVVCKKPRNSYAVTTPTVIYPTPGSSQCKKGWTLYKGMCYIVGNSTSSDYLTWQDAEKRCQSLGNNGHLVSIHSQDELNFIRFLTKGANTYFFWIGLNDMETEATYKWTDGSNFYFANWASREPNDLVRQENCVHLKRNGEWNDQHCQIKYSFVCKAYNETYKPPVKPTEPPRPTKDGYCPEGWLAHAQYCYEFHTHPSEYRQWDDARDACELGHNSSSYGELVSIHDEFEEAFLTAHLKGATQPLWLGMNNKHSYYKYFWVDNSKTDYLKWNTREPRWGSNRCVEIVPYRWAAGRWNSVSCFKRNGYICKRAALKTPVTPTPTPTVSNCRTDYKSYDESCFKFFNAKKTFDNARTVCQGDGGDLMIVDSQFRQAYLIYMLERYIGNVWIGYYHEPYSVFKFVDSRSAAHTYWGHGQPNRQLSQRSCTQANITGSNFGVWDDMDCGTTNPFICEIYKGEPKVTIPLNASCPSGWTYFNKHCYKHFSSSQSWARAQVVCARNGANLLSIHDDREQDFLIYFYQKWHPFNIWTGLNDRAVERGYKWVDNSPLDYINWHDGEPNDYNGRENCVEMQTRSGQWNDLSCSYYRQFMCKKKIECSAEIPLDSSMVTVTDTYNTTSMGADKAIITDPNDYSSAWCTNNTSGTSKIMIDFHELVRVTGITIMGQRLQYVRSFRIDYERDEDWRTFYPNRDFQSDIQLYSTYTSTTKMFKYPIVADGLSITPVTWYSGTGDLICMKIRLHGCTFVCQKQLFLGLPERISDNVISASSAKYPTYTPKQTAIQGHSWCAEKNDKSQWIQFKFDQEKVVSVIRTFGDKRESYVKTYSMQFSEDGNTWVDYVQHGVKRIFKGNNDAHGPMRHTLANQIEASYVRIIPITWNKNICMRISLLGCAADCSKPLLASGKVLKPRYSSSDKDSSPEYALFNSGKAWCTGKSPLAEQYLEIKFNTQYRLFKIATLPSPVGYQKGGEILSYTFKYNKGKGWFDYGPKGQLKILVGINVNDKSKPMVNELTDYYRNRQGLRTRAIRIYPNTFTEKTICMRVELYGCLAGVQVVPTTPSVTQKVVDVSVRFTSIEWNNKMSDKKSKEFATTSKKIRKAVESVYSESESFRSAKVLKLTKGSVVAKIELIFNPQFTDANETLLETAVKTGKVGELEVDKDSFNVPKGSQTKASKGDSDGLSGGAVAGVVITVLILVAVAVVVAFLVYRRRKSKNLFAPQHFDNPISYSSKAYDMDD